MKFKDRKRGGLWFVLGEDNWGQGNFGEECGYEKKAEAGAVKASEMAHEAEIDGNAKS